jgi:hypothetical protein
LRLTIKRHTIVVKCFRKLFGKPARDAGFTRQAILDFARSIDTDHADAVDYIDAWLNQVELL